MPDDGDCGVLPKQHRFNRLLKVHGESPSQPLLANADGIESAGATPQKAEVLEGRWALNPAVADFYDSLLTHATADTPLRLPQTQWRS